MDSNKIKVNNPHRMKTDQWLLIKIGNDMQIIPVPTWTSFRVNSALTLNC